MPATSPRLPYEIDDTIDPTLVTRRTARCGLPGSRPRSRGRIAWTPPARLDTIHQRFVRESPPIRF
jgi:hypothetical protein